MTKPIPKYLVRGAYSFDAEANSNESTHQEFSPSMTQQNQREEADINTIMRRFGITGQLPQNDRIPTYADFEDIHDFHTAQNAIAAAQTAFNELPAETRARFDNNAGLYVDFCSDPENLDTLRQWGLAKPKAPEAPQAPTARVALERVPGQPGGAPEGPGQGPTVKDPQKGGPVT